MSIHNNGKLMLEYLCIFCSVSNGCLMKFCNRVHLQNHEPLKVSFACDSINGVSLSLTADTPKHTLCKIQFFIWSYRTFDVYMAARYIEFESILLSFILPSWNGELCWILTPLSLDKMAAISQMIFWDAFSWMKSFVFCLKSHWSLFLMVQLTITRHSFR